MKNSNIRQNFQQQNPEITGPSNHLNPDGKIDRSIPYKKILLTSVFIWASAMTYYDFPQIYSQYLIEFFEIDTVQVSLLYSLYSLPNVLLSTVGSVAMERIGLGKGLVLLQLLVLSGLVLSILSVQYEQFFLMLIGRTFFGVGSELLSIGQASVSSLWFNGKYLSIALSLNRFCTYSFMAVGAFVLPELFLRRIDQKTEIFESRKEQLRAGLTLVLFLTLVFAAAVSILTLAYFFIEKTYLPVLRKKLMQDLDLKAKQVSRLQQNSFEAREKLARTGLNQPLRNEDHEEQNLNTFSSPLKLEEQSRRKFQLRDLKKPSKLA